MKVTKLWCHYTLELHNFRDLKGVQIQKKHDHSGHKMDTDVLHIVSVPTSVASCLALWDPSTSDCQP